MSRQPRLTADVVSSGSANGVTVHGVRPILIQPDGARTQALDVNRALAEFVLLRDSLAERHPRVGALPLPKKDPRLTGKEKHQREPLDHLAFRHVLHLVLVQLRECFH